MSMFDFPTLTQRGKSFFLVLLGTLLISCTEEPANDPGTHEPPPQTEVDRKILSFENLLDQEGLVQSGNSPNQKKGNPGAEAPVVTLTGGTAPDIWSFPGELSDDENEELEEGQKLRLANTIKPIIYGVGAAGITLGTTLAQSETLLTPPKAKRGGAFSYAEAIQVDWADSDGNISAQSILALPGYKGGMEAGIFGKLHIRDRFPEYQEDGYSGATRLIQELYRELEGAQDNSHDCLASNHCFLDYGAEYDLTFRMVLPGATFLMNKSDFQIVIISITPYVAPGLLGHDLDLLSGALLIPGEAPISLGTTHEELFARLNAENLQISTRISPQVGSIFGTTLYEWSGILLGFHRTNHGITGAEAQNPLEGLAVNPAYPGNLTIGGRSVVVNQTSDGISFELGEETPSQKKGSSPNLANPTDDKADLKYALKMSTPIFKEEETIEKLAQFLVEQFRKEYEHAHYRLIQVSRDAFGLEFQAVQMEPLEGMKLELIFNTGEGKLRRLKLSKLEPAWNPILHITLPASVQGFNGPKTLETAPMVSPSLEEPNGREDSSTASTPHGDKGKALGHPGMGETEESTPHPPNSKDSQETGLPSDQKSDHQKSDKWTQLAGFSLDSLVKFENMDPERKEATLTFLETHPNLKDKVIQQRVQYAVTNQNHIYVSTFDNSFLFKVIHESGDIKYARIFSIASAVPYGSLQDICGIREQDGIKIGRRLLNVMEILENLLDTNSNPEAGYPCHTGGSRALLYEIEKKGLQIVFSKENFAMNFLNNILIRVQVSFPPEKVTNSLLKPDNSSQPEPSHPEREKGGPQ